MGTTEFLSSQNEDGSNGYKGMPQPVPIKKPSNAIQA